MEPYYDKAEKNLGVTRTNGIPGLPGNNNFKVFEAGAKKLGYKNVHTGRMAINSEPRDGRTNCQQVGFFSDVNLVQNGLLHTATSRKGEATGNLEVRTHAQALKSSMTLVR